jgi:hypothetical protein
MIDFILFTVGIFGILVFIDMSIDQSVQRHCKRR